LIGTLFSPVRASSLKMNRISSLLLCGACSLGLGMAGLQWLPYNHNFTLRSFQNIGPATHQPEGQGGADLTDKQLPSDDPSPLLTEATPSAPPTMLQAAEEIRNLAESAIQAKPETVTRQVELDKGQTFAAMLTDADVDPTDATAIASVLDKVYDHRKLKAGQEVTLAFTRVGETETLNAVTLQPEYTKELSIVRGADGLFKGEVKVTPLQRQRIAAQGTIRSSLFEAGQRAGVPRAIMAAMIRAYSHAVDFQRDLKPGDKFEVLYDQPTAKDGTPVGQGVIIYAALHVDDKIKPLYRVTFADGTVDYFDDKGQSLRRSLLRTPVDGARMTSGFGMRLHPILGYSKMHKGIDFGAAIGTPIFAAGSGVIEEVGFKGAYGRYIRIRHNNTIKTAYAHMSRFGRGMYQGAKVNQGDVIGFVGASGRATGAHLHYEVMVNNEQVNPMKVSMPTGRVLEGKLLSQFMAGQSKIKQEFSGMLIKKQAAATKPDAGEFQPVNANAPAYQTAKSQSCGQRQGC